MAPDQAHRLRQNNVGLRIVRYDEASKKDNQAWAHG